MNDSVSRRVNGGRFERWSRLRFHAVGRVIAAAVAAGLVAAVAVARGRAIGHHEGTLIADLPPAIAEAGRHIIQRRA